MTAFDWASPARWSAIVVSVGVFCGCGAEDRHHPIKSASPPATENASQQSPTHDLSPTAKETKKVNIKKLILSKSNEAQRVVRLGTLKFDDSNRATLVTEGSGPAVEKLKKDWAEVSSKPELTWKMAVPGEVNGESVTRIVGESARPGEETYPESVLSTMERSYGYRVEIAD